MLVDSSKFFKELGFFASGVTVNTRRRPTAKSTAVTLNGLPSVFTDPPPILNCLAKITGCLSTFSGGERFAGTQEPKFKNRGFETWDSGDPILLGCLMNLECPRVDVHIERLEIGENGRPPLSSRSAYGRVEDA